jgi:hypothetical protein
MADKKKSAGGTTRGRQVPVVFHIGDDIVSRAATNLVAQCGEHESFLSFFEANPPIIVGTPTEQAATLASVESVLAKCVARVVIPTSRLGEFIEAMRSAHEKYERTKATAKVAIPMNEAKK